MTQGWWVEGVEHEKRGEVMSRQDSLTRQERQVGFIRQPGSQDAIDHDPDSSQGFTSSASIVTVSRSDDMAAQ